MTTIKFRKVRTERLDGMKYVLLEDYYDIVPFLGWAVHMKAGMLSDGATGARDLGVKETGWRKYWAMFVRWALHMDIGERTSAWWSHDQLCNTGCLTSGRRISVFQCSLVLSLLLWRDGYHKEAFTWFLPTFFFGGGKCRDNGMLKVKPIAEGKEA